MKLIHMKLKLPIFLVLIVSLLFLGIPALRAQTTPTPAMMQMITGELQKRGLTEVEVRTRLLQEGIDLENIPPAQLPQYQARVTAILDKMEAEKKAAGQTNSNPANQDTNLGANSQYTTTLGTTKTTFPVKPKISVKDSIAEVTKRALKVTANVKDSVANIYGHSLFSDKSLAVLNTNDGAQVPDTYVLGEGDEIHITIFGASQTDIQQRISVDGSIQPTGVAKIFLKGLTLAQAREVIKRNLSKAYMFRNDQVAVTIVTARTLLVNVFGEVKTTGGFNLSALNSAFNALSAAGGPTAIGSVRNIQLIHGTTRKSIDLYAFMDDPAVQFKFELQNNDIIFVPVVKELVSVEGAVKRPMSYEMLADESLTDLIKFAGGLTMNVYPNFVQIQRYANGEQRLMEWNLVDVMSGKIKIPLLNGDSVRIKAIGKPMDQYVEVEGSVYYPGRFDLSANSTLSALLANAKPTYQAKTDILFINRLRSDSTTELLTVPFPDIKTGSADFKLQARDIVRIMDMSKYRDIDSLTVSGQVRKPFMKIVSLKEKITVQQAIDMAGGLKTSVYPVAYIFRKNLFNPKKVNYIRVDLAKASTIELQAGDKLNIYDNRTYTNVGELRVFGAVKNPNGFTYDASMSVHDLLINAGGFNVGAAFNRVEVFRTILSPTEKTKLEIITIQVDSNYQVISPKNFSLQPYDQVVVRLTPEFTLGRTVELNGQVKYPGTYVLESRQTKMSDVVKMAGGLLFDADPYGTGLFRTYKNRGYVTFNVKKAMENKGGINNNPILFEGDVVNINRMENTVSILETGTRMAQYSIHPEESGFKNVVFHGRSSAARYIRNFAGGFQKYADRNSVTVTLPNNEMRSTRHFLFFRNYPTVESGSTITMKMDVEKINKDLQPTEKQDFETTMAKSLSMLMSTLSIILLLQRL